MNVVKQCCMLVLLFALLAEVLEIGEAYKAIRPYKYYHRRPWRRPRWHIGQRSPKFYRSKRIPSKDYSFRKPDYYRYPHSKDEHVDHSPDNHPYTIVIQLPKRNDDYDHRHSERSYEKDSIPAHIRDNDYIEDEEDADSRMLNVNGKNVKIKVTKGEIPKLNIKISRIDTDDDIEIIDKSNMTAMNIPLESKVYTNLTLSMQPMGDDWSSEEDSFSYPNDLERK